MSRKHKHQKLVTVAVDKPEDDISVLLPNRDVPIAGRFLTVREFTLADSLAMHHELKPIIASLADVMQSEYPGFDAVMDVLAQHAFSLPLLVARSCDQPVEWVNSLPASEGSTLIDTFWTANRRFFMTAAIRQVTIRAAMKKTSDTAAFSPHSSGQAITQNGSPTTPIVS
ncbi:DUF6631 family protein [Serratia sp. L9]|uniref:DUF6631 family protein n=1 Tax=Serratia sp. L9 TaxID=3423946 RepID=UPI003D669F1E